MSVLKYGTGQGGRKPNPLVELHPGFEAEGKQTSPYLRLVKFALRTDGQKGVSPDPAKTGRKGGQFTVSVDNTDFVTALIDAVADGRGVSARALVESLNLSDEVRVATFESELENTSPENA